jgi:hypothetical protein
MAFPILFGLVLVVPFLLDADPPAMPRPPCRNHMQLAEIAHRRAVRRREPSSIPSSAARWSA